MSASQGHDVHNFSPVSSLNNLELDHVSKIDNTILREMMKFDKLSQKESLDLGIVARLFQTFWSGREWYVNDSGNSSFLTMFFSSQSCLFS